MWCGSACSRFFPLAGILFAIVVLLFAACPASTNNDGVSGGSTYDYVCANGTPADGTTDANDTQRCTECNDGFKLVNEQCVATKYTCDHGTPTDGKPEGNVDVDSCKACNTGYFIPHGTLVCAQEGTYFCENGTARTGSTGSTEAVHLCESCFQGYTKRPNNQCTIAVYTCSNGTPVSGGPSTGTQDVENCQSCSSGYIITAANTCNHRYICNNGTPTENTDATSDNVTQCADCHSGYLLEGVMCRATKYTCQNGVARTGTPGGSTNVPECASCHTGYIITAAKTCNHRYICNNGTPVDDTDATGDNVTQCESCASDYFLSNQTCLFNSDDDNDGVLESNDIDDDNDGLIEVHNLTMLHNMRYNLAGTSYKTSSADTGSTTGAPTSSNKAADYACSGSAGLCGYELTQNLSFDKGSDGTFTESNGTYTLDIKDNNATYFPISSGAGGWLPIGDDTNPFVAIFEGNGYTIHHLAISRDQEYIGMFGRINTEAAIRNIGLINSLADYSGNTSGRKIGGLVGSQTDGTIRNSYADVTADGGAGSYDRTGGLVGLQQNGTIIASYATGTVHAQSGTNQTTGGLVGSKEGGTIIASYATGTVDGGSEGNSYNGGLVGYQSAGTIIASYATGSVEGREGDFDYIGGLVGFQAGGTITASYATGSVDGGTGSNDVAGKLVGLKSGGSHVASYGFGTKSGHEHNSIDGSTRPNGITTAVALTAANLTGCVGIANEKAYTSQTTCEATTKAACTWASSTSTCSGTVTDIDCSIFTTESTCIATTGKPAGTWNGDVWNAAASDTAGAWDFGTAMQAPALKYADFDGSGSNYNCNQFPANKCNTLIPGQR